mgnify:CR=1 FL=1
MTPTTMPEPCILPWCLCLQGELGKLRGQVDVLQLKVKEQREEVVAGRKELKHVKRTLRTVEVRDAISGQALVLQ